jgi:hypothetical protein
MINAEHIKGHERRKDVNDVLVGAARVNASSRFELVDKGTVRNGNFYFFKFNSGRFFGKYEQRGQSG